MPPSPRLGQPMSSNCSGMACSSAWISGWTPVRPETRGAAAAEAHPGRRDPPAVAFAGQHRGAVEDQRPPVDLAAAGEADRGPA